MHGKVARQKPYRAGLKEAAKQPSFSTSSIPESERTVNEGKVQLNNNVEENSCVPTSFYS
jgi:hypothetical protein